MENWWRGSVGDFSFLNKDCWYSLLNMNLLITYKSVDIRSIIDAKGTKFDYKSSLTDTQISHEVASTNIIIDA